MERTENALVLILGNGFDLELGLPTLYADFLCFARFASYLLRKQPKQAIKCIQKYDNTGVKPLSALVKKTCERVFDFMESRDFNFILAHLDGNEEQTAKNVRVHLNPWQKFVADNMWLEYFWKREADEKRWIDFESDIAAVVERVDRSRYVVPGKPVRMDTEMTSEIRLYLESEGLPAEGTYQTFKDKAIKDLGKLEDALSYYMCHDVESIDLKLAEMTPFLQDVFAEVADSQSVYVLTFNYTRSFERIYAALCRKRIGVTICHIHGEAEETARKGIVLGIDEYLTGDELQKNVDFAEFRKYYQRIDKETDSSYLNWLGELNDSKDAKLIIIGHSLGITDGDILAQFLNCEGVTSVNCYYHNETARKQQISNLAAILGKDSLIQRITGPGKNIWLKSEKFD